MYFEYGDFEPFKDAMQICLSGHVINNCFENSPEFNKNYCGICGKKTITKCLKCDSKILNFIENIHEMQSNINAPEYCENCGEQFPWLTNKLNQPKYRNYRKIYNVFIGELTQQHPDTLYPTCEGLGLHSKNAGDPWMSKKRFVENIFSQNNKDAILNAAETWLDTNDSQELFALFSDNDEKETHQNIKNIIFASISQKPDIILKNALTNEIEIVGESDCLVFDQQINNEQGLSLNELVNWWKKNNNSSLFERLKASIPDSSPGEKVIFNYYYNKILSEHSDSIPALLPQVHLFYDPKTIRQRKAEGSPSLNLQRIDFLMLFPKGKKIIIEVDGIHHYADISTKIAKPEIYAQMVSEDRVLKMNGYEIYRFGGAEFSSNPQRKEQAIRIIDEFFLKLFNKHNINSTRR